ncbi:MAG: septum formation initiator family protein [Bacteroidetes bacterium]|nr:MAG: septum formation initiator family protein [Bacteroidota bacterium]
MKSIKSVIKVFKNKYVLTILGFLVLIIFIDANSYRQQRRLNKELEKVSEEKKFYEKQIAADKKRANKLMSDDESLEKYAREHYLMKKDKEDVYLLIIK